MSSFPFQLVHDRLPVTEGAIADFARDPVHCMRNLWARHGEIAALQEDAHRIHFVFGPEYTKAVLSDAQRFHSSFFAIRGPRKSAQRRLTSGLLSMNGEEHRQHRRMVQGPFQKRAIASYHETVSAHSRELVESWQPGETRDMAEEMTHYMLRLTSSILFGIDLPELAYKVGELTERWVSLNHEVGPAAFTPDPGLVEKYDELLAVATELEQHLTEMVAIRRGGRLGNDVLSLLIRAHDMEEGVTDDQLIGHIALLFGAAHLTSAHTLTWTLFLLAQHPDVMRELYTELKQQVQGPGPAAEQIDQLPVLDRVLKESMRVLPASAYSQRITAEAVDLGPFQLRPGAVVIFSQFITHHLPTLYAEPERFLPDRWKTITPSPYAYLPFGAGPRMCIGAALGMMQLKISLPTMLKKFKMTVAPQSQINGHVRSTMLFPVSSVPIQLSEHDGTFHASPVTGSIHNLVNLPPSSRVQEIRRAA